MYYRLPARASIKNLYYQDHEDDQVLYLIHDCDNPVLEAWAHVLWLRHGGPAHVGGTEAGTHAHMLIVSGYSSVVWIQWALKIIT